MNPALYTFYFQLNIELPRSDFRRLVKHLKNEPYFDGAGDKTIFIKLAPHVPKDQSEVDLCKRKNQEEGIKLFTILQNVIKKTDYDLSRGGTIQKKPGKLNQG